MRLTRLTLALAILFSSHGWADDETRGSEPSFAAPVRIMAGGKFLGEGRLYPSPVLHDINGDGKPDVVVGDLRGIVTVAPRTADSLGAEVPLKNKQGEQLKFYNW